mgnify:FL=1|tara:strand:- start:2354 stop:3526 length:1173 start_codon:yes stop_codon:yes gene_type:complete
MFVDHISYLAFQQFFIATIVWCFSFLVLSQYLNIQHKEISNKKSFFLNYYIALSIVAVIRIFSNILPNTPDSFMYLKASERIANGNDFFFMGAFFYSDIIYFIKSITFDNHYAIIFLNNVLFIFALVKLLKIVPKSNLNSFWLWFLFLLAYPSIYWFVPNVLRESIFFYCIVNIFAYSLDFQNSKLRLQNIFSLVFFSIFSVLLRPQILPILFVWYTYVFFKKSILFGLLISLIGIIFLKNDYIISEYLSKISFEYLEAKKIEGAASIPTIAFKQTIVPNSFYELIILTPYLVFRFLFAPFPWEISNLRYSFAFLDSLILVFLFLNIAWNAIKRKLWSLDIVVFTFLFITILGVFEIAFTGAVRHRMPYILILSTLVMSGSKNKKIFAPR